MLLEKICGGAKEQVKQKGEKSTWWLCTAKQERSRTFGADGFLNPLVDFDHNIKTRQCRVNYG